MRNAKIITFHHFSKIDGGIQRVYESSMSLLYFASSINNYFSFFFLILHFQLASNTCCCSLRTDLLDQLQPKLPDGRSVVIIFK